MKIHEYQGKEILRRYGVTVPPSVVCRSVDEVDQLAPTIMGPPWVVKAQIHAGGRGKGGGVKVVSSLEDVHQAAEEMLGMMLVTHQTSPDGQQVRRLLIEEGAAIHSEMYLGVVIDRVSQRVVIIGSAQGGMDIESVAASTPEHIHRLSVDPVAGVDEAGLALLAEKMGIPSDLQLEAVGLFSSIYQAFWESDASLVEINPLILTDDQRLVALDAKFNFDDSALFRQPDIAALRDVDEENQDEVDASAHGLNYIALDGSIGCLVNGAGLAMATMDIIKFYGGEPANFLDVGGGATTEQVTEAFKLMLRNESLRAILVNIFGGIMRCDVVAEGLVSAAQEVNLDVPLVVRLEGTNVERGREILAESNIEIIPAATMAEAAEKVVAAAS
ncbi:MAG: ADP-forming succinate--CoA ligase subunit beta [Acidiferrobacteraceae bacterium]|nr:ADP-forming succinate--CoA ligase subunit beta [Acidiferrobacteraceae bacterium]|tara:strand:+ start:4027 stop:5187 length:1161 start_codon:yes stop_codon:yes gene_type:complete